MALSDDQSEQFQRALLDAFPTRAVSAQVIRCKLDENLEVITNGSLRDDVFNLITWLRQRI